MKKYFISFLLVLLGQTGFAFDIVYPKKSEVTINSPTTFFIGSSKEPLTINGKSVQIHPSSGFAYFTDLKNGKNTFELKTENETKIYTINRPPNTAKLYNCPPKLTEYPKPVWIKNETENAPLRSTPVDAGINRLAHLQKDVELIADGEIAGFYRIDLGNKKGYISKNSVKPISASLYGTVKSYEFVNDKEFYKYVFHLSKRVPFEITEGENFSINFYNIKNSENETYTFEFPYALLAGTKKIYGYDGQYDGNDFILRIRKPLKINSKHPLKGIKITIDAGHGGNEYGAIGCLGDKEKDVVLKIAKNLEQELISLGANVIMTRDDDTYMNLYNRVKKANDNDTAIFISIHANALPDNLNPLTHRGTSVYYYYPQAKELAGNILVAMNTDLKTQNDKIRQESFAVVRNTSALSILIETAYLINPDDNAMLIDENFQINCAKSIAKGIENYLK